MRALSGALVRLDSGAWQWSDGTPEPRVRDMTIGSLAPSFRCRTYGDGSCYVELPSNWRRLVSDNDASAAIASLVRDAKSARIFAEPSRPDGVAGSRAGYLLPIAAWDAAMAAVVGCWWDKDQESDILARAALAAAS